MITPKPATELLPLCDGLGVELEPAPPMKIADAFEYLVAMETVTPEEESLLFELAVILIDVNWRGLRPQALTAFSAMIAANGLEHYRPAPVDLDPIPEA
jgi:hypothetical protein